VFALIATGIVVAIYIRSQAEEAKKSGAANPKKS